MAPTALAMVLEGLVAYTYRSLASPRPEFFFLNLPASLVGGVKFVVSPLYLEWKVFGYKGISALVVYQAIMRLHMCDFITTGKFLFLNFGPYIYFLGNFLTINKLKWRG